MSDYIKFSTKTYHFYFINLEQYMKLNICRVLKRFQYMKFLVAYVFKELTKGPSTNNVGTVVGHCTTPCDGWTRACECP